ncbi:TolB family protein [Candidatus Leptofilum sp.]|uniref:TolB family protein n=1 Tax=Candidatus Leptofilum sp. TaxID=3241576 RepID=UPI003B5B6E85
MTNFDPGREPLVAMPEPQRPSGCRIALTLTVVLALLFMSASGAIWFLFFREQPQPDEIDAPIVETMAVPPEPTDVAEVEASATEAADDVNRIAYVTSSGQIVALSPDGSNARMLTSGSPRFQFPAWSPDGRSVAAIGVNRGGAGIFVLADAGEPDGTPEPLYTDQEQSPFYLYWSPDSRQVSFLASHPDGMGLHLVRADGSAESRLLTIGGPLYWQWTANSEQMLIHSGFSGEASRLELISAVGDGTGDSIAPPGFFQAPGISADGRYLAYAEVMTGNSSLVVVDTESETTVQERHAGLVALAWNPAANQLAFTNGTDPDSTNFIGPLRLLDAATGEVELISNEPILAFFWSPDGRYLAAISTLRRGDGDINAWLDGKGALGKPNQQQNLPQLRLLVYDLMVDEGRVLFNFVPTFTFATQFLPFFDQYALSHRLWSPDSSALVLPMLEDGRNQIYIINVATGQKRFLAEGTMPFWSPR